MYTGGSNWKRQRSRILEDHVELFRVDDGDLQRIVEPEMGKKKKKKKKSASIINEEAVEYTITI